MIQIHPLLAGIARSTRTLVCAAGLGAVVLATSCASEGFGHVPGQRQLAIELKNADKVAGQRLRPLPVTVGTAVPFTVVIRAYRADGSIDTGFNGYVRVSSKPGKIERLSGPDTDGRNIRLVEGESRELVVSVQYAYGPTYIIADDIGYTPVDALGNPPPACANGIDDDGDGAIDWPADDGCAFANDDDEGGSSYAQGASQPIFFGLPRVADVRGLVCDAQNMNCSGSGVTPYPKEPIQLDTGYHDKADGTAKFDFDLVVTRIASDGFYVTDISDPRLASGGGFNSIFAFNFNAPPRMRTCDRMKSLGGTANEFFGFTQMSYPTWTLEEWDPAFRPCLVPDPEVLVPVRISPDNLILRSGNLVRVETRPDRQTILRVTPKFGPGNMPKAGSVYTPSPDATNCDLDKSGDIDFTPGGEENACAQACTDDPECTEWSNFAGRNTFRLTVADATGQARAIQADSSTSASFDPVAMKGKELRAFTGTLHYFSGGSQFTIEARCGDDIIIDAKAQPFVSDRTCANAEVDCPFGYECARLGNGQRACRTKETKAPPPQACVFPRTFLDNNPQ